MLAFLSCLFDPPSLSNRSNSRVAFNILQSMIWWCQSFGEFPLHCQIFFTSSNHVKISFNSPLGYPLFVRNRSVYAIPENNDRKSRRIHTQWKCLSMGCIMSRRIFIGPSSCYASRHTLHDTSIEHRIVSEKFLCSSFSRFVKGGRFVC